MYLCKQKNLYPMNNNKQHRTSLKDLATELGVSIATVSRALHSSPEIGQNPTDENENIDGYDEPFRQFINSYLI